MFSQKHSQPYLANLDVLRFVLAMIVVVYHIPAISKNMELSYYNDLPIFNRGLEAVYWFFVLSGFLLSLLATNEVRKKRFSIGKFIQRRILRIWPLYFLVSVFGIFFYYFLLPALNIPFTNNASIGTTLLLTFSFLSNILHAYYDPGGILTITWSVSVEEQFYLLFPILVALLFYSNLKRRAGLLVFFTAICCIHLVADGFSSQIEKVGLFLELFLIGALAAEFFPFVTSLSKRIRLISLILSMLLFVALFFTNWLLIEDSFAWRILNGGVAGIAILALAVWHKDCSIQWLVFGGKISYGIYMYHMIVITGLVFLMKKLAISGVGQIVVLNFLALVLSYLLAWFSFSKFESRFLAMKRY